MATETLRLQIDSLETQLKVLKSQLSTRRKSQIKKFSDLKGIWKGKVEFSADDIRKAQLSLEDKLNDLRG